MINFSIPVPTVRSVDLFPTTFILFPKLFESIILGATLATGTKAYLKKEQKGMSWKDDQIQYNLCV